MAIKDAMILKNRIKKAKNRMASMELDSLIVQMKHPWFDQICDWAGVDRSHVLRLVLSKKHCNTNKRW